VVHFCSCGDCISRAAAAARAGKCGAAALCKRSTISGVCWTGGRDSRSQQTGRPSGKIVRLGVTVHTFRFPVRGSLRSPPNLIRLPRSAALEAASWGWPCALLRCYGDRIPCDVLRAAHFPRARLRRRRAGAVADVRGHRAADASSDRPKVPQCLQITAWALGCLSGGCEPVVLAP